MYLPNTFRETRPHVLHEFVRANSFASLISHGPDGLAISHLPMLLRDSGGNGAEAVQCTLLGHLARANPQWRHLDRAEVMVLFAGPHAYVSPRWYESRSTSVPMWNYANVYARGVARVIDDDGGWMREMLRELTTAYEGSQREAWSMEEMSPEYFERQLRGIVGIEVEVRTLEGEFKLSQNRTPADQSKVAAALKTSDFPQDRAVAELINQLTLERR